MLIEGGGVAGKGLFGKRSGLEWAVRPFGKSSVHIVTGSVLFKVGRPQWYRYHAVAQTREQG